jgi:hypothetical protein
MIQSLHILRKDIEHLWSELSLYLILLLAASITAPMAWNWGGLSNTPLHLFISLLNILLPLIWVILIARLVHDEALVGDTQFWITRPYFWGSLLSAKLLFIAVCVVFPFAVMQWALVLQAGVNPFLTIPGQLIGLLQAALVIWLTLTVVASVTSTTQGMLTSVLATLAFWGVALTALGTIAGTRMPLPFASAIIAIVIGGLLCSILLYQYARRHTFASRIALIATAVLFIALFSCLVEGVFQAPINFFVRHHYPGSKDGSLKLVFDANHVPTQDTGEGEHVLDKQVFVRLPITIQGLDPMAQLDDQNVSFTIDAPGYHYTSPWRPADLQDETLMLLVPQKEMDASPGSNVHLQLSEVAQRLLPGTPQIVTAADEFSIPGNGTCQLLPSLSHDNVSCRYPFEIASRTMIHTTVADTYCNKAALTHPAIATLAARSPHVGPDPTIQILLRLGGAVCPGTPLTFTAYRPAYNFRLELDIPSIKLNRYLVR